MINSVKTIIITIMAAFVFTYALMWSIDDPAAREELKIKKISALEEKYRFQKTVAYA
jgi:hypothetical protein